MNEKSIGSKLKEIRNSKKISQADVVQQLSNYGIEMSRETLSKIENESRSISADELNVICKVFGVEISELFEQDEDLVTMFRHRNYSEEVLDEIEELQTMIKVFLNQKKIFNNAFEIRRTKPLWEECEC